MVPAANSKVRYTLTEKHLIAYTAYVREWMDTLGLHGWEFDVKWSEENVRGSAEYNLRSRGVMFMLGRVWYQKPTRARLSETALHECLHVLLAQFQVVCETHPHD